MNIILIDDDFFFQKAMSFFLEELQHTVHFAHNGEKAMELLSQHKEIDLLICDLEMPVMPGHLFLKSLEDFFPRKRPVIVVVSGLRNGKEFLLKEKIHYDYYFKKPMDVNVFSKTLDEIISKLR